VTTPFDAGQIGFLQHRVGDLIKGRYERPLMEIFE